LVFSGKSHFDDDVLSLGGAIYRVTPRRRNPIKNYLELINFFRESDYKVIHIHQGITYFAPLIYSSIFKIPIRIIHSYGMAPKLIKSQGIFFELFTRRIINGLGTHFVSDSIFARDTLFGENIINKKPYKLIPNSVDLDNFNRDNNIRLAMRERIGCLNRFVIGHVGNFTYPKNHNFIIDIFASLILKYNDAYLVLVGDGPNLAEIKLKVERLNLTKNVLFFGKTNEVYKIMNSFDLFIFPSHFESSPVALIEAQACGLPCLVSNSVPAESKITDLVSFMDLKSNADDWAEEVIHLSIKKFDYTQIRETIESSNYNVAKGSIMLSHYYKELVKSLET
jgi:glycosyltransferase involved in cell wall biosynthesis